MTTYGDHFVKQADAVAGAVTNIITLGTVSRMQTKYPSPRDIDTENPEHIADIREATRESIADVCSWLRDVAGEISTDRDTFEKGVNTFLGQVERFQRGELPSQADPVARLAAALGVQL